MARRQQIFAILKDASQLEPQLVEATITVDTDGLGDADAVSLALLNKLTVADLVRDHKTLSVLHCRRTRPRDVDADAAADQENDCLRNALLTLIKAVNLEVQLDRSPRVLEAVKRASILFALNPHSSEE